MRESTRNHQYPYTFRSAVLAGVTQCFDKVILYIVPPEDALQIEGLYVHFRMTFDSAVPSGDRVVRSIGICNEVPLTLADDPALLRVVQLNQAADINRKVDIRVDLTHLLVKGNVRHRDYFTDPGTGDLTYVIVQLDTDLRSTANVGTIDLWKIDALFTTKGIR